MAAKKRNQTGRLLPVVIAGVFILLTLGVGLWLKQKIATQESLRPKPTIAPPPTLSPEEIEIVEKITTHTVKIQNNQVSPPTLKIKLYDQVEWVNKDDHDHQIKGENWGNVLIGPEESFTQAFEQEGTYPYSCKLVPTLKGTIIVSQ